MFEIALLLTMAAIALCAAFFSVTGIAHLFAGSVYPVMVMASSLELGKLLAASFLYRYWTIVNKVLRTYLIAAVVVLMCVTSIGIYGYLTSAYASIAAIPQTQIDQISLNQTQQNTADQNIARYQAQMDQIARSRTATETRLDAALGHLQDGTNSSSTSRTAQRQLDDMNRQTETLQAQITKETQRRDSLASTSNTIQSQLNTNGKIGTFYYVARALGVKLDTVVNWFTLVLVCVFDPLSLALVLAYNTIIVRKQKKETVSGEKPDTGTPVLEVIKVEPQPEPLPPQSETKPIEEVWIPASESLKKFNTAIVKTPEVVKRKRGRPRKNPLPTVEPIVVEESTNENVTPLNEVIPSSQIPDEERKVYYRNTKPFYYRDPDYDWEGRKEEWENDPEAVQYFGLIQKSLHS